MGFNAVTNYRRADCIVIDEPELRLAARDSSGLPTWWGGSGAGSRRRVSWSAAAPRFRDPLDSGWIESAGLATRIVDRTGAGDALFALTSPCAYAGMAPEILAFVGNCAGPWPWRRAATASPWTRSTLTSSRIPAPVTEQGRPRSARSRSSCRAQPCPLPGRVLEAIARQSVFPGGHRRRRRVHGRKRRGGRVVRPPVPFIALARHEANQGVFAALRTGWLRCRGSTSPSRRLTTSSCPASSRNA